MKNAFFRNVILLLTFTAGMAGGWAHAQDADYTVDNVMVEASGANATAARDAAISTGQQEAFKSLLQRFDPEQGQAKAGMYSAGQIANVVRGFEVLNEKITGTTYRATLKIAFDPTQVEQILRIPATTAQAVAPTAPAPVSTPAAVPAPGLTTSPAGTQPVNTPAAPYSAPTGYTPPQSAPVPNQGTLILPVLRKSNALMLWEEDNNWRSIWNSVSLEKGSGMIIVPFGDPSDMAVMDAQRAIAGNFGAFRPLAARYGAQEVIVAEAQYVPNANPAQLTVNLHRMGATHDVRENTAYQATQQETPEALMIRAAQVTASKLYQTQAELETAPDERVKSMTLLADISSISEWAQMQKYLQAVPSITKTDLAALSFRQADVVIEYRGSTEALARGIMAQGLRLSPAGKYWSVALP